MNTLIILLAISQSKIIFGVMSIAFLCIGLVLAFKFVFQGRIYETEGDVITLDDSTYDPMLLLPSSCNLDSSTGNVFAYMPIDSKHRPPLQHSYSMTVKINEETVCVEMEEKSYLEVSEKFKLNHERMKIKFQYVRSWFESKLQTIISITPVVHPVS